MIEPTASQQTPSEILAIQTQYLNRLYEAQMRQTQILEQMAAHQPASTGSGDVRITDFRMGFWSLVVLLVKIALAAIPAVIILWTISAVILGLIGFLLSVLFGGIGLLGALLS